MQTLKPEVRERINNAAAVVFEKYGYERASMRTIAQKARMTAGNLYRYYKNKETLFEALVEESYQINKSIILSAREGIMHDPEFKIESVPRIVNAIAQTLFPIRNATMILYHHSKGTKYEHMYTEMFDILSELYFNSFKANTDFSDERARTVASLNSYYFINANLNALMHSSSIEEFKKILQDNILFHRYGIYGYMRAAIPVEDLWNA